MRARLSDLSGHVERNGGSLGYEMFGHGEPTILLLPTWTIVHSRVWRMQVPCLSRHYRLVTCDGPGNGRSDRSIDPSWYSAESHAEDAVAALPAWKRRPCPDIPGGGVRGSAGTAISWSDSSSDASASRIQRRQSRTEWVGRRGPVPRSWLPRPSNRRRRRNGLTQLPPSQLRCWCFTARMTRSLPMPMVPTRLGSPQERSSHWTDLATFQMSGIPCA